MTLTVPSRTMKMRRPERYVLLGRLLVFLAAVLTAAMPFTEQFWTFDHFLRGGQDFELGMLCLIASFCLTLLLAQHGVWVTTSLAGMRDWLSLALPIAPPTKGGRSGIALFRSMTSMFASSRASACSFPLQI